MNNEGKKMEGLFFLICSGFFGYMIQKLERLEQKIDTIEVELLLIKTVVPKRQTDP